MLILLSPKVRHLRDSRKLVHQAQSFIINLKNSSQRKYRYAHICLIHKSVANNIEQRKNAARPPPAALHRSKAETIQELLKAIHLRLLGNILISPLRKIKPWWENNSFEDAFTSEPQRVKRHLPTISINLPKYFSNSPSNYPRKNNSMLESISKCSYDCGSSTVRGFNIDKHHDNICC